LSLVGKIPRKALNRPISQTALKLEDNGEASTARLWELQIIQLDLPRLQLSVPKGSLRTLDGFAEISCAGPGHDDPLGENVDAYERHIVVF
jgi:hypothetical protein